MEDSQGGMRRRRWRSIEEEKTALDGNPMAQSLLRDLERQGRNRTAALIDRLEAEGADNGKDAKNSTGNG